MPRVCATEFHDDLRVSGMAGASEELGSGERLRYLPALDGARAVAVAGVIGYHLDLAVLPGGFLGVDLFFVLSGFLITSLLMREYTRRGAIDLAAFWVRRARRLLPALFLVIGAIALVAAWSSPFDRTQLRWDILSSLAYATNWRFIAAENSYFGEFAAPSPVLHLWSLAIEEQFYLVWPLVMLGALMLLGRRSGGTRAIVALLVAATATSAILLAQTYDPIDPSAAYYATQTRGHELLVGAIAAVLLEREPAFVTIVRRGAKPMAVISLGVLLAFAVLLSDSSRIYYVGGSLIFSLAAAGLVTALAVTAAGDRSNPVLRVLSLKPLPWVGALSYGLYLWHWPLILWVTPTTTGIDGPLLAATRLAAIVGVAAVSFYLVERPIRRGWLGPIKLRVREVATGATAIAVLLMALAVYNTRGAQPLPVFLSGNRELITSDVPNAVGSVGLVGDSVAMSLYPGLAYEAAGTSRRLVAAAFPGCPVGSAQHLTAEGEAPGFARRCPEITIREQTRLVHDFNPDVIFWLSNRDRLAILQDDEMLRAGSPQWEAAAFADWDAVLARLTAKGASVVLILPFHSTGVDPRACIREASLADPCPGPPLSINALRYEYVRWAARHATSVVVLNPDSVVCPENPCPTSVEGVDLRSDSVHFTEDGARLVIRRLLRLLPAGVWQ
jgi:peptidoglycan/LPS O-acetylase OafA/YrhL